MENTVNLGKHSLFLKVVFADPTAYSSGKALPTEVIKFNVIEGVPFKFIISHIESPLKIGVPFQISLKLVDYYGNSTKPDKENMELTITGSGGLALSHGGTAVRGMLMFVRDVVALGSLSYNNGKDFNIKLVLTGLDDNTQVTKLRFLPGLPSMLEVKPLGNEIRIGNGENLKMEVVVKDKVGNITPQPELNVVCKLSGRPGLPSFSVDCSSTGKGILTSPDIDVADIRDGAVLQAKINLLHFKSVETVKKSIYVSPSIRPAQFQLFYVPPDSEIPVRIHNDDELLCKAGDFIQGITYRILDEGKRLLNIDSNMTYKVKVNWVSKLSKDQLKLGNLPDIRTPTIANETKFCQICYNGITNVHFTFTIRAISNKIDVLSSLCSSNKIIPGEKFSKIISVSLTDKYGNKINPDAFDVKDLQIYGGGIITEKADVEMNKSGEILISNLDFCDNIPGVRELHLQYKGLQAYQRLEMLPGPVAELVIVDHENLEEPVSIYNGHPWKELLRVQMVDAAGYSCREVNKKIYLVKEGDLKISPSNSLTQRTDANGVAVFKDFCLTSPTCSGTYGISPKLHLDQHTVITGPSLTVHVLPDPNKSTSILVESFPASVKAGQPMEVTKGCVLAEDRNPLTKLSHKDVTLCIQLAAAPQKKGKIYYASQRELNDKMNFFHFRDITAPEKAGLHSMFINYNAGSCKNLHSEKMMLIVTPDEPAYLSPLVELPTPTVSNTNNVSSRTLVKNFKLNIMDEWRNRTGEKLTGRVIVSVNNNLNETPLLNNNQTSVCYPLIEGAIDIDHLTVAVGTSGLDCQEYQLEFKLILVGQMKHNVKPYVLPFLFYNDAKKQQQMSQLVKDRDALVQSINTYRTYFKTTQQLINEMKVVIEEDDKQTKSIVQNLTELKMNEVQIKGLYKVEHVDQLLTKITSRQNNLITKPRRMCKLAPYPRDPLILGKVAQLAEVENDDVAKVLSWHMAGDMDCIVTATTEKAKQVYKDSRGTQQVLPLDSIFRRNLPEPNKPLPHQKLKGNWKPKGNPTYARHLLKYKVDSKQCDIVFGMLLGDTILIDDLDSANDYRHQVVKFTYCPTILTRTGDRLRSNGKFGGLMNKAPAMERLHGAVFSAPVSSDLNKTTKCLELLHSLKSSMESERKAKEDLELQISDVHSDEMQSKYKECLEAEKQLKTIERKLGMIPLNYDMPVSP